MKTLFAKAAIGAVVLFTPASVIALAPETEMLLDLLKTKGVITEEDARQFKQAIEEKLAAEQEPGSEHFHSVQSIDNRLEKLEKAAEEGLALPGNVRLGGLVEVEASAVRTKDGAGNVDKQSDIVLATARLDMDAAVNEFVGGHVAFLHEEGKNDNDIAVDEGIITVTGGEKLPLQGNFGKMYVPFGRYKSHFITDPLTLALGETNDTAAIIGYADETVELKVGAFKGAVRESGRSSHVNSLVGSAAFTLPQGSVPDFGLSGGISYLSNLAASDTLQGFDTAGDGEISDLVGGFSAFVSLSFMEKIFIDLEYLGALKDFTIDDLTFVDADNRRPRAWNTEVAVAVTPKLEMALRYGGSKETGSILEEDMYGAALLYGFLHNTYLTLEYLRQEFDDNGDGGQATMQLAVEF